MADKHTPMSIPADAAEKAAEKAKTVDFYAELTDEEREEEGLPPRPTVEAERVEKAEPAQPAPEKPGPRDPENPEGPDDEPEDVDETDEADDRLLQEIAGLREDLNASLSKEPASGKETVEDPLITAALAHGDEVVRGLAERLQKAEQRLEARETEAREQRVTAQMAKDDAEFDAVQSTYAIDGKPMTDEQVEQVEKFILQHPGVAALSIEQVTRAVFPGATKRGKAPPAQRPGASPNGEGPTVATIVDQGSSGGSPSPGPFKPRPNETIESAIQEAGKRFGWKR